MPQRVSTSLARLLTIAEWGMVAAAIGLVVLSADFQPWMLLSVGALLGSVGARWLRIGRLALPSPLDTPLFLFSISVGIAWWVAPDRDAATLRLLWYLVAVALFYSLNSSDGATRYWLGRLFAVTAAIGGFAVVSQRDWSEWTRFAVIGRIGQSLNQIVPDVGWQPTFWNVTRNQLAAVLALAVPFVVMWLVYVVQQRSGRSLWRTVVEIGLALLTLGLLAFDILMTESRTPWLLLPIMLLVVGWWLIVMRFGRITHPLRAFWLGMAAFAVIGVLAVIVLTPLIPQLPGPDTFTARQAIYTQSLYLAQDAPFTGAGLDAFPRYYSEYIRVVPVNAVYSEDTGNNALQIVWVEQGWLGAITYILLFGVAAAATTRYLRQLTRPHPFIIAGSIALAYVIVYAAIHAMLVDTRAAPFLLLPAGFALAGYPVAEMRIWRRRISAERRYRFALVAVIAVILVIALTQWNNWRTGWTVNMGVLAMARQQFADWPTGEWDDGSTAARLGSAEQRFEQALTSDPDNATAHHRLGLIAMMRRDYAAAAAHLQAAYDQNPGHDGIRKNLGLSYAWLGDYEVAQPLLAATRDARQELDIYRWWWLTQGEAMLSDRATQMAARLNVNEP
ncbi:MAG: O-antigen ligase family protein [Anaerolineae bacterium]|nr:O-antigen ligase family protein [Anaerolineae bacterium]